jgi:hypothetical protein
MSVTLIPLITEAVADTQFICRICCSYTWMGNRLDGWGSIPGKGKIFLFSVVCRKALGPTQPPIQSVVGAFSPGVKLTTSSSAEVKNSGTVPSLPHMSSWRVAQLITHRDNFTFLLFIYYYNLGTFNFVYGI